MPLNIDHLICSAQRLQHSRAAFRIADALIYQLSIAPRCPAYLLPGGVNSRDNREAVAGWVANEVNGPNVEYSRQIVEMLLPRLRRELEKLRAAS